jgi:outer membrane protein OmpA-like peptidoglycan-associated protein
MDFLSRTRGTVMPQLPVSVRPVSFRRVFAYSLIASLVPVGTAYAQGSAFVRVTRDQLEITSTPRANGTLLMVAPRGTVLEVVHTQGDRYAHREANVYWILVPPDVWGVQRIGWIAARDSEPAPAPVRAKPVAEAATRTFTTRPEPPKEDVTAAAAPAAAQPPVAARAMTPSAPVAMADVVLNFEFNKSDLTAEAQAKLVEAVTMMKSAAQGLSFSLEGHADWVGPEAYNEKLGLARAESVKRALCDQHQIPTDKITIVSYGEVQPATSNATAEGRAQNRRVVIKVVK